jgi:hypothetical protein
MAPALRSACVVGRCFCCIRRRRHGHQETGDVGALTLAYSAWHFPFPIFTTGHCSPAWVYCECSFVEFYSGQKLAWDIIHWLSGKGFRLDGVFNTSYDSMGQAIQADFLFRRIEAAAAL